VVEEIPTANSNVGGPKEAIVSNSSVSGPKVAYRTKVAGPKVTGSNNGSAKGEPTLIKLSQIVKVLQFHFLTPSAVAADSDSSSCESLFKNPHPPKPLCSVS